MASESSISSMRPTLLPTDTAEQLTPRRGKEKYTHVPNHPDKPYTKMYFIPIIKGAYPLNEEPKVTCINFSELLAAQTFYDALRNAHTETGDGQHQPKAYSGKPIFNKCYDNDQLGIEPLVFVILCQGGPKSPPSEFLLAHFNTPEEAAAYTNHIWETHKTILTDIFGVKIIEPYKHGRPDVSASSSEPPSFGASLPPSASTHLKTASVHASPPASLLPPSAPQPNIVYSSSSVHAPQPVPAAAARPILPDSKGSGTFASAAPVPPSSQYSSPAFLLPRLSQPTSYSSSSYIPPLPVPLPNQNPTPSAHASHPSWASQAPVGLLDLSPRARSSNPDTVAHNPYPETPPQSPRPSPASTLPSIALSISAPASTLPSTALSIPAPASTLPSTALSIPAPAATAVHASPSPLAFQNVSAAPETPSAGSDKEVWETTLRKRKEHFAKEGVIGYTNQLESAEYNEVVILESWKKSSAKEPTPFPGQYNDTDTYSNDDDEYLHRITSIPTIVEKVVENLGEGLVNIEQSWPSNFQEEPAAPIGFVQASFPTRSGDRTVRICTCFRTSSS